MHFFNPTFGAFAMPPNARRLRSMGRTCSLVAVIPAEFVERLNVGEAGAGHVLGVIVRDGLYLYPATADQARTLTTITDVIRSQRQVLHAMGAPC